MWERNRIHRRHRANKNGLKCQRVNSLEELVPMVPAEVIEIVVCRRCHKASTIDHHGGKWCTNCGTFASPPNPKLLPSLQPGFEDRSKIPEEEEYRIISEYGGCHQKTDMTGGIYDDGEWMCGGCIDRYSTY